MTRQSLVNTLASHEPRLPRVWEWHEFQRLSIGEEMGRVLGALARGESPAESRYFGKTRKELDAQFAFQVAELSLLSMFGMLACTEATLRLDFFSRVKNREKGRVSRCFRSVSKKRGRKIRLQEDILDSWREHGEAGTNRAVGEFKGVLKLRDWLAHGRYWRPKLGRAAGYDVADVFNICSELLQATGLAP